MGRLVEWITTIQRGDAGGFDQVGGHRSMLESGAQRGKRREAHCVNYLLLRNKLKFLTLYNNKCLLSHSFCESGIWEWLSLWFWLRVSHEVTIKLSSGLQVLLPRWLPDMLARWWWLAGGGLSSSACGRLHNTG